MDNSYNILNVQNIFNNSGCSKKGHTIIKTEKNNIFFYFIYNIFNYKNIDNNSRLNSASKNSSYLEFFKRFKDCEILLKENTLEITKKKEGYEFGILNQYTIMGMNKPRFALFEENDEGIIVFVDVDNSLQWSKIDFTKCELIK